MTRAQDRTAEMSYLTDSSQWVRRYPAGRVCAHPFCKTVLSIYNPDPVCGAHVPDPDWRYQGYTFSVCADCGDVFQPRRNAVVKDQCPSCAQRAAKATDEITHYRTCSRCGRELPVTPFFWEMRTRKDGTCVPRRTFCRDCRSKDYYSNKGTS